MKHKSSSNVISLNFVPYEDVLGVGLDQGYSSLVIPGSGEANFDAYEANPFATKR
jgi:U3 small nucleolar RNA-associated protein 7